jgi:hypothetical protein
MPVAGPVKGDDAECAGESWEETRRLKVLESRAITMEENNGRTVAVLAVVKTHSIYLKEVTFRRIFIFRTSH